MGDWLLSARLKIHHLRISHNPRKHRNPAAPKIHALKATEPRNFKKNGPASRSKNDAARKDHTIGIITVDIV
jgi:hypothetical protein